MKIVKNISIITVMALAITVSSCKKLLEEHPKNGLYVDYLQTEAGIKAGITGCYRQLSQFYTGDYNNALMNTGTDEWFNGGSSTAPQFGNYNINPSNGPGFTAEYQQINTLNGIMDFVNASTSISAANKKLYLGQAQFLRGFYYFYLVQEFGGATSSDPAGIPLHTTFLQEPVYQDAPAKLTDIYDLIISDFTNAASNLPNTIVSGNPFSSGGVGKTATAAVANTFLAKAYLTRGYTSAGSAADFQKAADITAAIIANKATYGLDLWQDYNDVYKPANDYGKENMLVFDVGSDPVYSGYCCGNGRGYNNMAVLYRWSYNLAAISNVPGNDAPNQKQGGPNPLVRDVYNGRSYVRNAFNRPYLNDVAFADQVHDTRYDASFQTFWICDQAAASGKKFDGVTDKGVLKVASNVSFVSYQPPIDGDTAVLMPGVEVTNARRDNFKGLIIAPSQYNNNQYPAIKKWDDITRIATNDLSSRPVLFTRFAEVYMINAEANYMLGNTALAAQSLNVIRTRAAYRTPADGDRIPASQFRVTSATQAAANAANAAFMQLNGAQLAQLAIPNNTAVGSGPCGMDLILDEYTREFCSEPRRWLDLVRTGQLLRRVTKYNTEAAANIKPFHTVRPIPQGEIDKNTGPKYPQHPGY